MEQEFLLLLHGLEEFVLEEGEPGLDEFEEVLHVMLAEEEDDKEDLDVDLDDGFTDEGGREEGQEGDLQAAASDPCQVEQRVGDRGQQENSNEGMLLYDGKDEQLNSLQQRELFSTLLLNLLYLLQLFPSLHLLLSLGASSLKNNLCLLVQCFNPLLLVLLILTDLV